MNRPQPGQAPDPAWQIQTLADSARRLAARGELKEAEKIYRTILETAPYHVRALNFLAVQATQRGELDQSELLLERALRAAPERPILHQNLALVHEKRGKLDLALAGFEKAIQLKPSFRTVYLHKGALLEKLGRRDEAVVSFWQAWRQFPNPELLANDSIAPANLRQLVAHAGEALRTKQIELIEEKLEPIRSHYSQESLSRVEKAAQIYVGSLSPGYQHALQRPSYLYLPDVPPQTFFERSDFPWMPLLEEATTAIREELQRLLTSEQGFAPYVQIDVGMNPMQWRELDHSPKWSSFHLLRGGVLNEENCARCPRTLEVLQAVPLARISEHAPEAFFSILKPGTHIPPHSGLGNYKLVTHLPLIVPQDCSIRVGNETRSWTEGEGLIFDDSFQHEVWNRSGSARAVLILDVWNPLVTAAEREGVTALVEAMAAFNRQYRSTI